MAETIEIGQFLMARLQQLGIRTVFGVPGDFQLTLLDKISPAGLKWAGSANELIAAYAADGYARINGTGAIVTTFGPGELSALNGIAGAYCEFVPVVHIVGYPSTRAQNAGMILHHTLGDGRFDVYHDMSKSISCATTVLHDKETAVSEIDRVLKAMLYFSRPVYIGVPIDMVHQRVPADTLMTPLPAIPEPKNEEEEAEIVCLIENRVLSSKQFALIVDMGVCRFGMLDEVLDLIETLKAPHFVTAMARASINEKHPCFGGLYGGELSDPRAKEYVEAADCVLKVGNYPSDLNTGAFTESYKPDALIDCRQRSIQTGGKTYTGNTRQILRTLVSLFQSTSQSGSPRWLPLSSCVDKVIPAPAGKVTFDWLLHRLSQFFRKGDLVVVETGSVSIGMTQVSFPEGVSVYTQTVWGSIGYATGSAVGAFTAALEQGQQFKRPIIITGEGSIQMTIQALGDMLRLDIAPIILVLNNEGYTCERMINGMNESYNDVATWNWQDMLKAFGPNSATRSYRAGTSSELEDVFGILEAGEFGGAQLVEISMDKQDVPSSMKELAAKLGRAKKTQGGKSATSSAR